MFKLPFIIPDDELELNLMIVILIVDKLNATSRGTLILDIERLIVYFYLIKNPHILNKLLIFLGKKNMQLKSYELASFKAENIDIDTLYDNKNMKDYLHILISKKFISINYNEKIGFVYTSTDSAKKIINLVDNKYLNRVQKFINKLEQTTAIVISKINTSLKLILKEDT